MNYAELGQKVKAKYPDYKSLSDEEVGRKVASKYPSYQAQISNDSPVQKGADILRTLGLGIVPNTAADLYDAGKAVITPGKGNTLQPETYQNPLRTYGQFASKYPQLTDESLPTNKRMNPTQGYGQVGKDSAGLASWMVPMGGSVKAAAGLGAGAGALQAASQDNQTLEGVAKGAAVGAVAGPVIKGVGNLLGKGTVKAGKAVEEQGEQLVLKGLKPSPSQLTKFKEKTGQDLADWLNKQKISGNFVEETGARIDDLQGQFDDLAINSGAKVKSGKLQQLFIKRMSAMNDSVVPAVKAKAEDLKQIMDNLVGKYGDDIDVKNLTQERRNIDTFLKEGQFSMPIEQSNYLRSARDAIQEAVQEATKGMGTKDLKTIGLELRSLYEFKKIAEKQSNLGRGSNILGLIGTMSAGTGGVVAGFPGVVGGILASKAMQSPTVIRGASSGIRATGKGIQAVGKKAAVEGRFDAMQRALRNLTANQASRPQLLP